MKNRTAARTRCGGAEVSTMAENQVWPRKAGGTQRDEGLKESGAAVRIM